MFFTTPLFSAALMMLTSVTALPQPEAGGLMGRQFSCPSGSYQYNQTACVACPAGNTCNGGSSTPQPCDTGLYQPNSQQAFCYGAPKGRFQQQSGKSFLCATCCGWAATQDNNNVNPVNCTGSTPYAWPNSGDGCISSPTSCTRAATCAQAADGTCPGETVRG
ncbi:hypothetical protein R3P38DRAFT_2780467 [Favolaschia claudopus]|uniref:Uncharacterized protein n=1 Tax=Favolaschia claudopus TaxID=2862362 RepID=A0AAW0B9Z5_9AGAR